MNYLVRLLVVALMVVFVFSDRLIPINPQAGKIVTMSEPITDPLPHRSIGVAMNKVLSRPWCMTQTSLTK